MHLYIVKNTEYEKQSNKPETQQCTCRMRIMVIRSNICSWCLPVSKFSFLKS